MIQPSVIKIAAIAGLVLLAVLLAGFAIATHSAGSAIAFVAIVGGVGVWFFRSARHR